MIWGAITLIIAICFGICVYKLIRLSEEGAYETSDFD